MKALTMIMISIVRRAGLAIAALLALIGLSGCSSFNLGAVMYCPHGQACEMQVDPPASADNHSKTALTKGTQ